MERSAQTLRPGIAEGPTPLRQPVAAGTITPWETSTTTTQPLTTHRPWAFRGRPDRRPLRHGRPCADPYLFLGAVGSYLTGVSEEQVEADP